MDLSGTIKALEDYEPLRNPQRRCVVFCNQCDRWDKESGLTARRCTHWERFTKQHDFCSYGVFAKQT